MILILEPEKLTARLIFGFAIIIVMISALFGASYWKDKLAEFDSQKTTISQLKNELDEEQVLVAKLQNELTAKRSEVLNASVSGTQLREKNKKLEADVTQCQATVNSQKSTIRIYKEYYYLTNGR